MTVGLIIDVPAAIEVCDTVHAEIGRRMTGHVEGLLCHLGRPTPTGQATAAASPPVTRSNSS
jgi:hypothetical protein